MNLLQNISELENPSKCICIVSNRDEFVLRLNNQLNIIGNIKSKSVCLDFFTFINNTTIWNSSTYILDVSGAGDVGIITSMLTNRVPQGKNVILIGDVDAISFMMNIVENGYYYLLFDRLFELDHILSFERKYERKSKRISILGCKGGVGATYIAKCFFDNLMQKDYFKAIYVQGSCGSVDIDYTHELESFECNEIYSIGNENYVFCESKETEYAELPKFNQMNVCIYDTNIHVMPIGRVKDIVSDSSIVVFVIDRSISSKRLLRNIIDELKLIDINHDINFHILQNENLKGDNLSKNELKIFFGRPVDVFVKTKSDVDSFVKKVFGDIKDKNVFNSIFRGVFNW